MFKNIVFDIGNVILNFDVEQVLSKYTEDKKIRKFIKDNIIYSPEWLLFSLIDTGYVKTGDAIKIVCNRTNHVCDDIVNDFWTTYNNYAFVDKKMIDLILNLRSNNYRVYLLSNTNSYTFDYIKNNSNLFDIVNGYVLSYEVHMVKPYKGIYNELLNKYHLQPSETLFVDDNEKNVQTAISLNMNAIKVEPDNYDDVFRKLLENNIRL